MKFQVYIRFQIKYLKITSKVAFIYKCWLKRGHAYGGKIMENYSDTKWGIYWFLMTQTAFDPVKGQE